MRNSNFYFIWCFIYAIAIVGKKDVKLWYLYFIYFRDLGNNKSILIEFGNEKQIIDYWIRDQPLIVITHGWRGSDEDDKGVFAIKTGRQLKIKIVFKTAV